MPGEGGAGGGAISNKPGLPRQVGGGVLGRRPCSAGGPAATRLGDTSTREGVTASHLPAARGALSWGPLPGRGSVAGPALCRSWADLPRRAPLQLQGPAESRHVLIRAVASSSPPPCRGCYTRLPRGRVLPPGPWHVPAAHPQPSPPLSGASAAAGPSHACTASRLLPPGLACWRVLRCEAASADLCGTLSRRTMLPEAVLPRRNISSRYGEVVSHRT